MSELIIFGGRRYRHDSSGWWVVHDERSVPIYMVSTAALDEIKRLRAQHRHCDHCGGTWLDDGINSGCYCLEIERLKAEVQRLREELDKFKHRLWMEG